MCTWNGTLYDGPFTSLSVAITAVQMQLLEMYPHPKRVEIRIGNMDVPAWHPAENQVTVYNTAWYRTGLLYDVVNGSQVSQP